MRTWHKVLLGLLVWPLGIYWAFKGAGASRTASTVIASVGGVILLGITVAAASGGDNNEATPSREKSATTASAVEQASGVKQKSLQAANRQVQRLRLRLKNENTDLQYAIRRRNDLRQANATLRASMASLRADLADAKVAAKASYKDGYAQGYSDAGSTSSGGGTETAGCDPNYEGACVPNTGYDVNCADVAATDFSVVGEDVDGLDGDGDGIACES
jgi:hypothetical protein